jgi:hypothetical protein
METGRQGYLRIIVHSNKMDQRDAEFPLRVEACSNTSTVAVRVVRGDEKGTSGGCNWATLFLGDKCKEFGESRI